MPSRKYQAKTAGNGSLKVMLSVCIITKNEEQNIRHCLECLAPTGFEIIVADTGSADRTREIAAEFTDKVYDFPWCDDFAAAKNFAVSKASQPYVMVIDSDEFLENIDLPALKTLLQSHPHEVGRILRKNVFTRKGIRQENKEWLNRIFPKEEFHYEGRIHEQVMALDGSEYETYQAPVTIFHTGYDLPEEQRKAKARRNFVLLKKELERLEAESSSAAVSRDTLPGAETEGIRKQLEEQFPYILYQLGKSCYMEGEYQCACDYFSRGLSYDLNPKLEYVIDMVETYGYALLNSGQAETALFFENIYEEFGGSADFQFLMGLIYMNNGRFEEAVKEFRKAASQKDCRTAGVNSYSAYYNIGVIHECLGNLEEAERYYKKCGNYEPALTRLRLMKSELG